MDTKKIFSPNLRAYLNSRSFWSTFLPTIVLITSNGIEYMVICLLTFMIGHKIEPGAVSQDTGFEYQLISKILAILYNI